MVHPVKYRPNVLKLHLLCPKLSEVPALSQCACISHQNYMSRHHFQQISNAVSDGICNFIALFTWCNSKHQTKRLKSQYLGGNGPWDRGINPVRTQVSHSCMRNVRVKWVTNLCKSYQSKGLQSKVLPTGLHSTLTEWGSMRMAMDISGVSNTAMGFCSRHGYCSASYSVEILVQWFYTRHTEMDK